MGPTARIRPLFPLHAVSVRRSGLLVVAALAALALSAGGALAAQPPVGLGNADSFAVLAGSTVTNTGSSTINGDLGVSPGTSITGFGGPPNGTVHGTIHSADAVAGQAQTSLTTAYNDAAGRTPAVVLASAELAGQTLTPGVYQSPTLGLTGTLTLNAQGNPNAVFIFQAGSTLTTAVGSSVKLINGAQPCNVFWKIGSSASLGTSSVFVGNILALTSISVNDSVTIAGRTLARNGAVTLINDTITAARCSTPTTTPTPTPTPGGTTGGGSTSGHAGSAHFGARHTKGGKSIVVVSGHRIAKVVFTLGGKVIATRHGSPFTVSVPGNGRIQTVTAVVTFTDQTPTLRIKLRFKSPAVKKRHVVIHHAPTPSRPMITTGGFTG
jgi:hypothetical protein